MNPRDPILDRTLTLIERVVGPGRGLKDAGAETRLGNDGFGLDSVELLDVLVACEEEFGIVFDEARELGEPALENIGTLAELIRSKHRALGPEP